MRKSSENMLLMVQNRLSEVIALLKQKQPETELSIEWIEKINQHITYIINHENKVRS